MLAPGHRVACFAASPRVEPVLAPPEGSALAQTLDEQR
jgi:hypothetical protein